jgi:hypothetical protein
MTDESVGRGMSVPLGRPLRSDVETKRLVLQIWPWFAGAVSGFRAQVVSSAMGKPDVPWRMPNGHPPSSGSLQ